MGELGFTCALKGSQDYFCGNFRVLGEIWWNFEGFPKVFVDVFWGFLKFSGGFQGVPMGFLRILRALNVIFY